jgi:hypothetical protein
VKVWSVRKRDTKTPSYGVRWSVAGNVFSESFRTKALADHYRTKLMRAMRDGEEFDTESGLPASMEEKKSAVSWYAFALRYLAMKWPHAAPNTRDGINEALTSVTLELLDERAGRPSDEVIRRALRNWAFVLPGPDDREVPDDVRNVLHWVSKASRPLADLAETGHGSRGPRLAEAQARRHGGSGGDRAAQASDARQRRELRRRPGGAA